MMANCFQFETQGHCHFILKENCLRYAGEQREKTFTMSKGTGSGEGDQRSEMAFTRGRGLEEAGVEKECSQDVVAYASHVGLKIYEAEKGDRG